MHIVWILGGAGFMFAILQGGLTVLVPSLGMTWTPLIVSSVMIAVVLTIERVRSDVARARRSPPWVMGAPGRARCWRP